MIIGVAVGVPFANVKNKLIVLDKFDRADSTSSLGKADTGQSWQAISGTWGISSNRAYVTADGTDMFAILDAGISDGEVSVLISGTVDYDARLSFRIADVNNWFIVDYGAGCFRLVRKLNGAYTELASYTAIRPSQFEVKAVLDGQLIKIFIDGVQRMSVTDSNHQTVTKHGIGGEKSSARLDDFTVRSV